MYLFVGSDFSLQGLLSQLCPTASSAPLKTAPLRGGGGGGGAAPAEVRTTSAAAIQVRGMPTCATRRDGVIGPRVHSSVGQGVDDQDNTRRSGARGPHGHSSAAGHVVDDLSVEGSGQQRP